MHTPPRLLLVDDDRELCELLANYLTTEGFTVDTRHDGRAALAAIKAQAYALLVLDVMMPELNGMDVLKQLREQNNTPVLMLTAKGDPVDRIIGLELGADDYLAKPCDPRELLARIKAILRRTTSPEPVIESQSTGALRLQSGNRTGYYNEQKLELTGAEYTVLSLLVASAGEVLSKDTLTERALGRKLTAYDRSIDVHVSNIRKKIHDAGGPKELIINIRGAGYMLTLEPTP
ncbi:response regulator transcription factor [Simiduia sp. 21SJ11W-1]|uniref:response regulator transcription factor n=1 Tax=Simiduia sp. 21SJ11W-1 TaxID=2909669 RepID=UPI0020A180D7|nr:response regulator transcription factor [Simiduia sp. 21SJ11W-1]UTA49317.1 response regulator transcription factor [Simiduia sp. 21SJ11W-1]